MEKPKQLMKRPKQLMKRPNQLMKKPSQLKKMPSRLKKKPKQLIARAIPVTYLGVYQGHIGLYIPLSLIPLGGGYHQREGDTRTD